MAILIKMESRHGPFNQVNFRPVPGKFPAEFPDIDDSIATRTRRLHKTGRKRSASWYRDFTPEVFPRVSTARHYVVAGFRAIA
jgi:hypothetical protein